MPNIINADSIIFDLDGTLWDSTETCAKAWQSAIDKLSYIDRTISTNDVRSIVGMQHDLIFPTLFPLLDKAQQTELMNLCGEEEINFIKNYGAVLYENVENTLNYLSKDYTLAIVSNCQAGYIEAFLDYYNFHKYFFDFECSGRTSQPKVQNIEAVISRNKLVAPLYVGDTQGDRDAALQNKIPFVFATYGFGKIHRSAYKIESIAHLKQLVNPIR